MAIVRVKGGPRRLTLSYVDAEGYVCVVLSREHPVVCVGCGVFVYGIVGVAVGLSCAGWAVLLKKVEVLEAEG